MVLSAANVQLPCYVTEMGGLVQELQPKGAWQLDPMQCNAMQGSVARLKKGQPSNIYKME